MEKREFHSRQTGKGRAFVDSVRWYHGSCRKVHVRTFNSGLEVILFPQGSGVNDTQPEIRIAP